MSEVAVVSIVESGDLEHKSRLLVESIRRLEPDLAIYMIKPRRGRRIKPQLVRFFEQNKVTFVDQHLNRETSFLPFANKIYASEYVERMHGPQHRTLIYLDADVLVLYPLHQLVKELQPFEVALKPSDNNSGMGNPADGKPDPLWQWIYQTLDIDLSRIWTLSDYTSGQLIRAYYNGGVIVKSATNQLFQRWLENFHRLTRDPYFFRLTGLQLFFLEQMCLTASILQMFEEEQVKPLDNTGNYPYNLHQETRQRIEDTRQIKLLHYHHEFTRDQWKTDLKMPGDLFQWLDQRLPLPAVPKKSKTKRFFEIMAYQRHKLRYKR